MLDHLAAMGITRYRERGAPTPLPVTSVPEQAAPMTQTTLPSLAEQVSQCEDCALCETRTQTVFGVGNPTADLLVVGEAPGFYEDKQGEPFVGKAGQLLDAMLKSIGLSRETIYIANVLKCRPPENRDPTPEEVAQCTPYLEKQVELIQPKIIVAVGRVAAHYLLQTTTPLSGMRQIEHTFRNTGIPLFVTYHPAYLLRNPADKRLAYQDLLQIQKALAATLSSRT
ncbi:MAG: uracil-DNA glycosylase [marine bacterium B5-7]|nr:MAG: uracil-DNA glycosylase [marine bacterium B5-7]